MAFLKYWLPPLVWMVVIFGFSGPAGSARQSSRILGPLLRWLHPGVTEETIQQVQFAARKGGHLAEYALLAWLLWRALRRPVRPERRPWDARVAAAAWGLAVLYAFTDEWHQSFVASRDGSVADVFIDAAGAGLGLMIAWALHRWRRRR